MTQYEIIPARAHHCGQMARRLRATHLGLLLCAGIDPHAQLRARFYESAFCKSWLIDGQLAAMGGVVGSCTARAGYIWLALSELAMKHPVATVREAKRQIEDIMRTRREVQTVLIVGDEAATRFATFMGFHIDGNEPAESRRARRWLSQEIQETPELRVHFGAMYAVPIVLRRDPPEQQARRIN
jgi:hypothetical protein